MDVLGHIKKRSNAPRGEKKPRKVSVSTIVMTIVLVAGLAVMAYPTISDWWNSYHQTRAIEAYVEAVEGIDQKTIDAMFEAARQYNERLAANANRFNMTDEERAEYNSLLDITGSGIMGYVQIPTIGVNLPIYHGIDETHLQVAVGHIEGTSLPVGGLNTHVAVSAHRGLPSAKLFTDLDKMAEGDIFMITVLNQTFTYEVDLIRIVEPTDLSDLTIDPKADQASLITCTPYGINTHRIVVRGHRVENQSDRNAVPAGAVQIPGYIAILTVAIPLLFAYLLGALIYYRRRRPELDKEKALQAVREHAESLGNNAQDVAEDKEVKPTSEEDNS